MSLVLGTTGTLVLGPCYHMYLSPWPLDLGPWSTLMRLFPHHPEVSLLALYPFFTVVGFPSRPPYPLPPLTHNLLHDRHFSLRIFHVVTNSLTRPPFHRGGSRISAGIPTPSGLCSQHGSLHIYTEAYTLGLWWGHTTPPRQPADEVALWHLDF